ncbi:DUF4214 domain-containing protein [Massilia agilis]|uniref:DUF4214 domain-containing protein n=1 Tax=Massilia agilis TaxID=1811226 RepID=A0ABT2D9A0_9BURK|nr:choice-of-anchor Q domain-containing protein [Massilia agilis]MCS0807901.1 DUF4214 domain-containing protein [Massilia agilis]
MKQIVTLASNARLNALLSASIAALVVSIAPAHAQAATATTSVTAAATPEDQITQLYQSLLNRSPDAGGLAYWTSVLNSGVPIDVIASYLKSSDEYQALHAGDTTGGIPATTYNYYVAPTGSDSAAGTKAAPFKTLARAAQVATKASTTVWVAPGTYTGGFKTTASGTATGRIYWVSTTKWGAKVVPGSTSNVWDNRGSYVNIIGFDIDGSTKPAVTHGVYTGGSNTVIQGNHVHHIAKSATCTSGGGSAIGVDSYYGGVLNDVIGNTVNDIGPAGCKYIQGIYVSTSGNVKNNLVYRVGEAAIHLWHDANHVNIINNTVTSSHYGIIVGGGDFYHTSAGDNYTVVNNNIVYDNTYGISEQGVTGKNNSYSNNLLFQNSGYNISLKNGLTAKNTVSSNPLFVAYSKTATTPDYHLAAGSPAIGRGTSVGALPNDIDGKPRNATTGYDIGAYQH